MIAPEDGDGLVRPLGFFPSADEPKDVVEKIASAIKGKDFCRQMPVPPVRYRVSLQVGMVLRR